MWRDAWVRGFPMVRSAWGARAKAVVPSAATEPQVCAVHRQVATQLPLARGAAASNPARTRRQASGLALEQLSPEWVGALVLVLSTFRIVMIEVSLRWRFGTRPRRRGRAARYGIVWRRGILALGRGTAAVVTASQAERPVVAPVEL